MSETLHAFHFLHPAWLWGLLAVPVLAALAVRSAGGERELARLADAELLPHLIERRGGRAHGPAVAMALAATLAVLALAGPAWRRLPQPLYTNQAAQVVAVSMSRHMLARDVTPDRLARVRYKVHALLDANAAGQNGLVAYAGAAFVVAPLTSDAHSLSDLLDALAPDTMPAPGNDAVAAIRRGVKLLKDAGDLRGSLVLVTDDADARAIAAAKAARRSGVRISVLGVGTAKGAPVPQPNGGFVLDARGNIEMARRDDQRLRELAAAGGGIYVPMSPDASDVQALKGELRAAVGRRDAHDKAQTRWIDEGPWLLLPLLLLMAAGFRRGWILLLPLMALPMWPTTASAQTLRDMWQRPDQQAASALAHGHAKQAEKLARDPAWRGAAAYRAGDYDTAATAFAEARGAQARYNEGNALARLGRYRKAIEAYDRALAMNPDLADARANRDAVKAWLRKHQPPKPQPKQGDSGKGAKGSGKGKGGKDSPSASKQQQGGKSSRAGQKPNAGGSRSGQGQSRSDAKGGQPDRAGADAKASKRAQSDAEKARKAMKQRMDRALGAARKPGDGSYALGQPRQRHKGDERPLAPAMRQALQRVPDDPGGLLRRKFMLEYQRRQNGGAGDGQ